jgi:hypothetical protein
MNKIFKTPICSAFKKLVQADDDKAKDKERSGAYCSK